MSADIRPILRDAGINPISKDDLQEIAVAWVELAAEEAELSEQLDLLRAKRRDIEHGLRAHMEFTGEVIRARRGTVVLQRPTRRPSARVNSEGVSRHREPLIQLGLVTEETVLSTPKVSDLRAADGRLRAHGIDPDELISTPPVRMEVAFVPDESDAA